MRRVLIMGWLAYWLAIPTSQAISVIGDGIGSRHSLFRSVIPQFFRPHQQSNNQVMLQSLIFSGGLSPDLVSINEFSQEYAEMIDWSTDQVREYFTNGGWEEVSHELDPCILWMDGESNSAYFSIATWGKGRGVLILGPRSRPVARAIDEFISGIKLEPGACQWGH